MYAWLFDESEEGPFEVSPGRKKVGVIRKPLPGSTKLYVSQESKSACVFCFFHLNFSFLGTNLQQNVLHRKFYPHLKQKKGLNFSRCGIGSCERKSKNTIKTIV